MENKEKTGAETMRQHIETCKSSGMTVAAYCKEHQLAPSKFYYWQKRLKPSLGLEGFTQVPLQAINTSAVTIHFPNGVHIAFAGSVAPSVLKELVCCI